LLDLVNGINRLLGKSIQPVFKKERIGDVKHSLARITKIKDEMGFEINCTFYEGLKKTIEFYK